MQSKLALMPLAGAALQVIDAAGQLCRRPCEREFWHYACDNDTVLQPQGGPAMHPDDESELVPSHLYRAVVSIVDAGSMTKAGQHLGLSQAAVSQQISRLEEILGGPVFDKSGAGLKLTERGEIVLDYARRFLTMNEQLLAYAGPHPLPRQFSIGMPKWLKHAKLVEIVHQDWNLRARRARPGSLRAADPRFSESDGATGIDLRAPERCSGWTTATTSVRCSPQNSSAKLFVAHKIKH
jgi:molybdenum-dependent DNA-binding transcriptional regulator ModE